MENTENIEIKRDSYLKKLIDSQHNRLIKIITGIRRCGKSYLLNEIFVKYLKSQGIDDSHIIKMDLESVENKQYLSPLKLYNYIKSLIVDKNTYYVLLDEIQNVDEFESVLNGFLGIPNIDVYVTGSNSKFLSTDIITEFRGRGDEIRVYPLSFAEFSSIQEQDINKNFNDYCRYGGLPLVALQKDITKKADYLNYQTKNVYLNDVIERNKIKNKDVLETLIEIISSNVGSLTNPKKLANTFNSKKISITDKSISKYLGYLENAFLIQKTRRYDIKGKKYINTPFKYYFTDTGIRNSLLNFRQIETNHIMENVIYNELLIRGYSVDVGIVEHRIKRKNKTEKVQLEVDFVCNHGSKRYYIQSAFSIPDEEKMKQEINSLTKIDDSFKKIVIVKDNINLWHNNDGILIICIEEFLLNKNSLDL